VFSRGAIVAQIAEADLTAESLLGAAAVTPADPSRDRQFMQREGAYGSIAAV
jgi:hypothetical protein